MDKETIFTKIINGEIPCRKVYEDESTFAFFDISPFELGHTLVVPKKVYQTIFEMPNEEFIKLMLTVKKIADYYYDVLGCGINIAQNNLKIAHQEVDHVHFHVIPRREEKHFYGNKSSNIYSKEEIDNIYRLLKMN